MIQIIANNVYSTITGLSDDLRKKLDAILCYQIQGYEYSAAFQKGHWDPKSKKYITWDGKKHLLSKSNRFYTGLVSRVAQFLTVQNIAFEIKQQRDTVSFNTSIETIKPIVLRDYQQNVVNAALQNNVGMIKVATGGGKSIIITKIAALANLKTMVYVISKDLLYQMHRTLSDYLGMEIGMIGDGVADVKQITVATIWSAATALGTKHEPVDEEDRSSERFDESRKSSIVKAIKEAQLIFIDESQFAACSSIQEINNNSTNAYFKYGLSGTPYREDGADLLLEAVCGKQIAEVTSSELINSGHLVKPTIYFIEVPPIELSAKDNYATIYKESIVENEARNRKIVSITKKLVEANKKVLLLVKQINHGKNLYSMLESECRVRFLSGEIDSETRNEVKQEFENGDLDVIVASTIFDIGLDLPILDALVLCGSGKSSGRALQRIGRVLRTYPNKKEAIVVDFQDSVKYLNKHSEKRLETYRKESGFVIKFVKDKTNADSTTQETKPAKLPKLPKGGNNAW